MYDHVTGQGADSSFSPRAAADHVGACREHGQRPAKAPPSIEGGGSRVFPKGYRSFTPEMVLETLRKHGPSTRIEMFEAVFGPDNLRDCGNPSSYLHKAIQVLVPGRIVECGHRNGSKVYRLAQQTPPLPAGLFTADRPAPCPLIPSPEPTGASASSFEASRVNHPAPADEHSPTSDCIAASQDATDPTIREEARRFVEISGRAFLSIPYRETDEAEALVAGIFADPTAPLIEQALVVGWRADLAEMAFASSPERRALRFAGLDIAKAEAAFGEIVSGHGLAIGEHAAAMRVVIDALSGAAAPSVTGKAWIEDAFATLRMPPPHPLSPLPRHVRLSRGCGAAKSRGWRSCREIPPRL